LETKDLSVGVEAANTPQLRPGIGHNGGPMLGPSVENIERVRVRVLPDGRMSRSDAARYIGMREKTLAMWTLTGRGPRWLKVGGRVFYFKHDLDAFIRGETP
jgi:hypothetical protein